jgi:hypothetical protein
VKLRYIVFLEVLLAGGAIGALPLTAPALSAATQQKKPVISEEASAALTRMGQTLRGAEQFSFQSRTIRVYTGTNGEPLHIFHTDNITVRRPNRLLVDRTGDDGVSKLVFDGKTAIMYSATNKKYASIPVPEGTIAGMNEAVGRLGIDFPLADFFTDAPDKAFLTGVTEGTVVNTVTIDGTPCLHMFFVQPPGIELELWVEKNDQSLPRRLIVTYRTLPGEPNFIALFSDWNFNIHPSDADFAFQPPADATQVQLKPVAATAPPAKGKGGKP